MKEKTQTLLIILILLLTLALPVVLGILAHSLWIGLLVFASLGFLFGASGSMGQDRYTAFFAMWLAGMVILSITTWLGRMDGRWVWSLPWLMYSLIGVAGGYSAYSKDRPVPGAWAVMISSLAGIFGVTAPSLWFNLLSQRDMGISGFSWEWLLCYAGIGLVALGWLRGRDIRTSRNTREYLILSLFGVVLVAAGMWLTGFRGGWSILPFWLMPGLMILHAARDVRGFSSGTATLGAFMATVCLAMAFLQPLWLERIDFGQQVAQVATSVTANGSPEPVGTLSESNLAATQLAQAAATATAAIAAETQSANPTNPSAAAQEQTLVPAAQTLSPEKTGESGWAGLGSFALNMIRSFWGWVYLILLYLLGLLWLKRWGGIAALLLAAAVVYWLGASHPAILPEAARLVMLSPWKLLAELLAPLSQVGRTGWRIVWIGLAINLLVVPALRLLVQANAARLNIPAKRQLLGTTFALYDLQKRGFDNSRVLTAGFFVLLSSPIIPILLWVALRSLSVAFDGKLLQFLFIGNLALPHWKPVFELPFFIPGVLAALILFIQVILQNRWLSSKGLPVNRLAGFTFIISLVLTLFVPSGVQIYVLALAVVRLVTLPLVMAGTPHAAPAVFNVENKFEAQQYQPATDQTPEEPEDLTAGEEPKVEPPPTDYQFRIPSEPPPVQPLATQYMETGGGLSDPDILLQINTPAAAAAFSSAGVFWVLDRHGGLIGLTNEVTRIENTSLSKPLGLVVLPDGQSLVVGGEGILKRYQPGDTPEETARISTSFPIDGYALNPFGSMLAYTSCTQNEVRGVFLAAQKDQKLFTQEGLMPILAFSPDGRTLGVAVQGGSVCVFDLSTRQPVTTLKPSFYSGEITSLHSLCGGGWLMGYAEKLVLWSMEGKQLANVIFNSPPCCVNVSAGHNQIAVGDGKGCVRIYSSDLKPLSEFPAACRGPVTHILFSDVDGGLVTIEEGMTFRKLRSG